MITYRQPFRGEWPITQRFGEKIEGVTYKGKPHTGIDYGCPEGTEILASADGMVIYTGYEAGGYGNYVILCHDGKLGTLYAHLKGSRVKVYDKVKQGDVIGLSGATGYVTGAHLHFEARKNWMLQDTAFDPMQLPLMSVYDNAESGQDSGSGIQDSGQDSGSGIQDSGQESGSGIQDSGQGSELKEGVHKVVCNAAYVRRWDNLSREKLVYKGETVYVFEAVRIYNGLPFYYIGAGSCMAAYDTEGTTILAPVTKGE